jgi:hypothetical protein
MKLGKFTISPDIQHWLLLFGSAVIGAVGTYLSSQSPTSLIQSLQSWTTAKPILLGALAAAVSAVVLLAKHTFITQTPSNPDAVQRGVVAAKAPTSFLPPVVKRTAVALAFLGTIAMTGAAVGGATLTSCTAVQWASFQTTASQFISYVQTYLSAASVIWQMISPMLGQNAAVANKAFDDAFTGVTAACALAQDGIAVANAAQQPLDLPTLLAPIKNAIAQLEAVITQFQPASGASLGTSSDSLAHMAAKIQAWR